jgi:tetratricopeptide (TPR) repeat protein
MFMGLLQRSDTTHHSAHWTSIWLAIASCVFALACGASSSTPVKPGDDDRNTADPSNPSNPSKSDGDSNTTSSGDPAESPTNPTDIDPNGDRVVPPNDNTNGGNTALATPAPTPTDPKLKTSKSPTELSAFLVKPAEQALAKKQWALAISYYSGLVAARGPASPEAIQLVFALVQENQYKRAQLVLEEFIAHTADPAEMARQKEALQRLKDAENPFSRDFRPVPARADAGKVYKLGRDAFKKKQYADALLYYQVGSALDPDLPGFLRELGATYDKLGLVAKKVEYLGRYLLLRPFGKNSDFARKELSAHKKSYGKLTLGSALPCDMVWLNEQAVPHKLPLKNLIVAPGVYTALCYNIKYDIAYFEEASVSPAGTAKLQFDWAIIVNKLENPFGRISVENALANTPGTFVRIPLGRAEGFGVVVPSNGRALQFQLTSLDGSKKDTRFIKIAPGSTEVIKW